VTAVPKVTFYFGHTHSAQNWSINSSNIVECLKVKMLLNVKTLKELKPPPSI